MNDMYPLMPEGKISKFNGKPHFEFSLTKENFNYFAAGCPEMSALVGRAGKGWEFYLYNCSPSKSDKEFNHGPLGYFSYLGISPSDVVASPSDWDAFSSGMTSLLVKEINDYKKIPIVEPTINNNSLIMGYVSLSFDDK